MKKPNNADAIKAQLVDTQAKLYNSKAERRELTNMLIDGRSFLRADVERVLGQWISSARRKLLAIPNGLAPLLVGHDREKIASLIRDKIEEATFELKQFDSDSFRSTTDYVAVEPDEEDEPETESQVAASA